MHLKNIYNDLELDKESTTEDFSIVQKEENREVKREYRVKQDKLYKSDFDMLMEESENYNYNGSNPNEWK